MGSGVTTTRAALGRMAAIGDLYDARTDNLCGVSIFNKNVPKEAVKVQDSDFMDVHLLNSDTISEKFSKLGVNAELQVSVLADLFNLEGSGCYFNEQKETSRTVKRSLLYNIQTKVENVDLYHKDLRGAFDIGVIESGVATHVVTGISWGANTVLSCTYENKENRDVNEIGNSLSNQLKKIWSAIKESASVDLTDEGNVSGVQLDLQIYGDVLPNNENLPTTFESTLKLMIQIPSLISTCNDGKGKPLMLRLTPISLLQTYYVYFSMNAITMPKSLPEASLIRVVQLFDEMSNAYQELNCFYRDALENKFCVKENDIQSIYIMKIELDIEATLFRSQLSFLLTEMRSGKKKVKDLEDFIKHFEYSLVSPQKVAAFQRSWSSLSEKISFAKTLVQHGARYIGFNSSFHAEILDEFVSKTFVLFFTQDSKSEDSSSWTENCQIFLNELKKNDNGCKYFAVDCDIHPALLPKDVTSCVQVHQGGQVICKDLLAYQKITTVAAPLAQFLSAPERTREKPNNRIPLFIPCAGTNCDRTTSYEWICRNCKEVIEYGFDNYVYCNCGTAPANCLEFKCTDHNHGVAFKCHSDKYFAELLAEFKELNILILGETGVGKSTWINGFVNFLTYESLDKAEADDKLTALIPSKFTIFDEKFEKITVCTGSDQNEVNKDGQSATQETRVYPFPMERTLVRLIDTPGVGDTRGIEQDKKNFQNMLGTLSNFQEIHGICILLKPNNARINVMFRFCIKELLTYLHRDASKNIMFCFTNSRGTFYRPGDTMPALQALLKENKEVEIVVSPETVYCFDSEAYRFLAAVKNNPPVMFPDDERDNFAKSWTKSIDETMRLLEHIGSLIPHPIQNTLNLNHTRVLVLKLTRPLAEISRNIQINKSIIEDEKKAIGKTKDDIKELEKMQWADRTEIEVKRLNHPKTVCSNSKCVRIWDVGVNDVKTTEYVQVCHAYCNLQGVKEDSVGDIGLMKCEAMNGTSYCRHSNCGHHYREHLHIYYDSIQVLKQVENLSVTESLKNNLNATEMKRKMIEEKNTLIEEYEAELKEIERASVRFAHFLKTNAITPYNDGMEEYLNHLIREEEDKFMCGGNNMTLKFLKSSKESYMQEKFILEEAMRKGVGSVPTTGEVMQLVDTLKGLKHNGQSLKDALDCIDYAGRNVFIKAVLQPPPSPAWGQGYIGRWIIGRKWGFKSATNYCKSFFGGWRRKCY